jgi:hypothetical protein
VAAALACSSSAHQAKLIASSSSSRGYIRGHQASMTATSSSSRVAASTGLCYLPCLDRLPEVHPRCPQ